MKRMIQATLVILACVRTTPAQASNTSIPPDRISFYEVPLVCPAAPQIGCGSRSKPILIQLEQDQSVSEAWLNRPGTLIALVWKPEIKQQQRTAAFEAVSKKEEFEAKELEGFARIKALEDFRSREKWHRSSDVDRLTEEEAGIIAARLVRRIQAKVSVSEARAKALQTEFSNVLKRLFTGEQSDDQEPEERLITILRSHLDEKDVVLLSETLPRSLTPLPGEQ